MTDRIEADLKWALLEDAGSCPVSRWSSHNLSAPPMEVTVPGDGVICYLCNRRWVWDGVDWR